MTPIITPTPMPDFATVFRQIVGEAIFGFDALSDEERVSWGLDQVEINDQILFEAVQASQSHSQPTRNNQQWESLKRKLSQTL